VTTTAAVAWATQPRASHPAWWTARLVLVRGFAKHLLATDLRTEVPPLELLPHRRLRATPHVYSDDEVRALMVAAGTIRAPLMAATYTTLIGLLAATGIRVGEAVALDRSDVDLGDGVLLIRKGKFGKTRQVPMHPTTVQALADYVRLRDRLAPRARGKSFFVSTVGTRLIYQNIEDKFRRLVSVAGLGDRHPRRPGIHDLRHTFAVRTVIGWHRAGLDVEARLSVLSTYLGHVGPSATYHYLSAVPDLLEAAAGRLEQLLEVRS
jgi:integrase